MRDMCVKTHQGTSSSYGTLPGPFPSDPVFEYDSVMKDGRLVKNAKTDRSLVEVITKISNGDHSKSLDAPSSGGHRKLGAVNFPPLHKPLFPADNNRFGHFKCCPYKI